MQLRTTDLSAPAILCSYSMGTPNRTVVGAFAAGFAIIGVALYAAHLQPSEPSTAGPALAVVSDSSLTRHAIPERDENGDGVPDWQEALNSLEAPQLPTASTSGFSRTETLTSELGTNLFKAVVQKQNTGRSAQQAALDSSTARAKEAIQTETLTKDDLAVIPKADTTNQVLLNYFNAMAAELSSSDDQVSVTELLERAVTYQDSEAAKTLISVAEEFDTSLQTVEEIPVPEPMLQHHLDLINALRFVRDDITTFAQPASDPMRTLLHLQRFPDDMNALNITLTRYVSHPPTFIDLSTIDLTEDDPAFYFVKLYYSLTDNTDV